MHITSTYARKAPCHLLRESYWENGKVKKRTLANLSALPQHLIDLLRLALANQHHASYLIVSEAYWPYCREPQPVLLPADAGLQAYVRQVREMFLRPTCVQAQFTSDDQQLATLW